MSTNQLSDESAERRSPRRALARLATEVLAPWVWVCALPLVMAWHATQSIPVTLGWGLLIALTGSPSHDAYQRAFGLPHPCFTADQTATLIYVTTISMWTN